MQEQKSPKKPLIFYYLIVLLVLMLLNTLVFPMMSQQDIIEVAGSDFMRMVDNGEVEYAQITDTQINFATREDAEGRRQYYYTGLLRKDNLEDWLLENGVEFTWKIPQENSSLLTLLLSWVFRASTTFTMPLMLSTVAE